MKTGDSLVTTSSLAVFEMVSKSWDRQVPSEE
jgi:hypothetical protein